MAKSILLVEDQDDFAIITKTILEEAGHLVVWANHGHIALNKAVKHKFDMVLLDLGMPDMSGEDIGLALLDIQPDIQVIIVSALMPSELKRVAQKLNGTYLFKPVTMEMLLNAVQPCNETTFDFSASVVKKDKNASPN